MNFFEQGTSEVCRIFWDDLRVGHWSRKYSQRRRYDLTGGQGLDILKDIARIATANDSIFSFFSE